MVPSVDRINHKKGQGLVEYALLIAMLALVIVVPTLFLGPMIGNVFSKIGSPLNVGNAWTKCADENYGCSFSGIALVRYGANSSWYTGTYVGGVLCANSVFGDPLYGTYKSCQIFR